jgi:hypothetical protein
MFNIALVAIYTAMFNDPAVILATMFNIALVAIYTAIFNYPAAI